MADLIESAYTVLGIPPPPGLEFLAATHVTRKDPARGGQDAIVVVCGMIGIAVGAFGGGIILGAVAGGIGGAIGVGLSKLFGRGKGGSDPSAGPADDPRQVAKAQQAMGLRPNMVWAVNRKNLLVFDTNSLGPKVPVKLRLRLALTEVDLEHAADDVLRVRLQGVPVEVTGPKAELAPFVDALRSVLAPGATGRPGAAEAPGAAGAFGGAGTAGAEAGSPGAAASSGGRPVLVALVVVAVVAVLAGVYVVRSDNNSKGSAAPRRATPSGTFVGSALEPMSPSSEPTTTTTENPHVQAFDLAQVCASPKPVRHAPAYEPGPGLHKVLVATLEPQGATYRDIGAVGLRSEVPFNVFEPGANDQTELVVCVTKGAATPERFCGPYGPQQAYVKFASQTVDLVVYAAATGAEVTRGQVHVPTEAAASCPLTAVVDLPDKLSTPGFGAINMAIAPFIRTVAAG